MKLFREDRLKQKALRAFKKYLESFECAQNRNARYMRIKHLSMKSIKAFKVRVGLAKIRKEIETKRESMI